jgi:hypothetical protein
MAWRQLDAEDRLQMIECALEAANDQHDGFPLAL